MQSSNLANLIKRMENYSQNIQVVFEMRAQILIMSYWLHVELGKNI
jgi:hypothetical protein